MNYTMNKTLGFTVLTELLGQTAIADLGIVHYNDYAGLIEASELSDILKIVTKAVNNLDVWDGLFQGIIQTGSDTNIMEKRMSSSFEVGSHDTEATASTPVFDNIVVQFQDYQVAYGISNKMFLADKGQKLEIVTGVINSIIPAYQRLLNVLALRAMTFLPEQATDKSYNPGFYRYIPTSPIAIWNSGFSKIPTDNTHYLPLPMTAKVMDTIAKKIRQHGYGRSSLWFIMSESTAEAFNDQFDYNVLEANRLLHYFQSLSGVDTKPAITGGRTFVTLPESDMPDGYILAFDPTVPGLYKRVAEQESLRGLVPVFNSDTYIATRSQVEFNVFGLGYGVVDRAFGAVAYVGELEDGVFVPPTEYVNPNFEQAIKGMVKA